MRLRSDLCARRVLRGLGFKPDTEHARALDSFLAKIGGEAGLAGETEASFAASAGRVLRQHVSAGQGDSVLRALPEHIRELLSADDG